MNVFRFRKVTISDYYIRVYGITDTFTFAYFYISNTKFSFPVRFAQKGLKLISFKDVNICGIQNNDKRIGYCFKC